MTLLPLSPECRDYRFESHARAIVLKVCQITRCFQLVLDLSKSLTCQYICGGLNENGSFRLIYLNVWLPVGVQEGLGGVVLLEEVCS